MECGKGGGEWNPNMSGQLKIAGKIVFELGFFFKKTTSF